MAMRQEQNRCVSFWRLFRMAAVVGLAAIAPSRVLAQGRMPAPTRHSGGQEGMVAASQAPRASLDEVVEGFTVDTAAVPQVFQFLYDRDHLIVGIEMMATPADVAPYQPAKAVSGPFERAALRNILDQVVARDPEWVWLEDEGVVNLVRRGNAEDPEYVLTRVVPAFDVDEMPFARALQQILLLQQHRLNGLPWGFGLRVDPDGPPLVTAHMRGATVRQVLNEIAWQTGLAWRTQYQPDDQMMGLLITHHFSGSGDLCQCETTPGGQEDVGAAAQGSQTSSSAVASLLPFRDSLVARGFSVSWDGGRRQGVASRGRTRVAVGVGEARASVNGIPVALPVPAVLRDGKLLVPDTLLRLVASTRAQARQTG